MDSTKLFDKYKEDKKALKLLEKTKEKLEKRRKKREETTKKYIENLKKQRETQIKRSEKKERTKTEIKLRTFFGKKTTKAQETFQNNNAYKKIKKKAFDEFQLFCRLSRSDDSGIITIGPCKGTHYKKVQGGHIYSKKNYPHIAFNPMNCRPITGRMNEIQLDQTATRQDFFLSKEEQEKLKEIANSCTFQEKEKYETKEYYEEQYSKYKALNDFILSKKNKNE